MTATNPKRLFVLSVDVKNVLGIRHAAIEPNGRAVLATGWNGSAKTSLLEAARATLGGGSLAKLQHVHANEEPEVVIVLDGPGGHYRVEKTGAATAVVKRRVGDSSGFEEIRRPQEFLSGLFDPKSANAVSLLLTPEKDLALMLLEALPLKLDRDQFVKVLGDHGDLVTGRELLARLHPLEEVAGYRDALFAIRTGVNTNAKGKREAAEQTRRNVPAVLPEDPAAEVAAAEKAVAETSARAAKMAADYKATRDAEIKKAETDDEARTAEITAAFNRDREALRIAFEAAVEKRKAEANELIDASAAECERIGQDAEAAYEAARDLIENENAALVDAREALAALRERVKSHAADVARKADAEKFDGEADDLETRSGDLTATLDRIDAFRRQLAEELPIPGLSIVGKSITRDGVPWSQLNEGQRCEIVATVAMLRAQQCPLPLIFLDGLEKLDGPHRKALIETLVAKGMQPFGAAVKDSDAAIEYIGAVTAIGAEAEPEPEPAPPLRLVSESADVVPMPTARRRPRIS